MRVSDDELSTLKGTFAENDELIYAVRKAMFFVDLTAEDKKYLKLVGNPDTAHVLRKMLIPFISTDVPLGQNVDLWMTIEGIKDMDEWHIYNQMQGRIHLINMLNSGLENVQTLGKSEPYISVMDYNPDTKTPRAEFEQEVAKLVARNTYISHVEAMLNQARTLAGKKSETVEQTKERLARNSSK